MLDPVTLLPDAFYDDSALHQAVGLSPATLAAARRSGDLRFSRRGNRTLYKGSWVLAWLESEPSETRREPTTGREGAYA
jgi:hypothetical protein